jgi:DNA-binding transcriptional MerR regulator
MTDEERLTLEQLAGAVGMTSRNVRAYQTRGLLQPPRRVGRSSVYGAEHVQRLQQVQRARARGASLQLLRTLIDEGRDLDGVWPGPDAPASLRPTVVDLTDRAAGHTPACLARRDVPLQPLFERLGGAEDPQVRPAVLALVERRVFRSASDRTRGQISEQVTVPGAFDCAASALREQGRLTSASAALRLAELLADAAEAVAVVVDRAVAGLDAEARRAASARFGELAGAVVGEVVSARVNVPGAAPTG